MNIEIANRFVELRKKHHLSQEELAKKLGVSRQAVSKWERAEASPDTDNLIALAQIYNITLDELLHQTKSKDPSSNKDSVHVSFSKGVHVEDRNGSKVHVGFDGIHIEDPMQDHQVHIDDNGVFVDGNQYDKDKFFKEHLSHKPKFPLMAIAILVFLYIGIFQQIWHPTWLIFLCVPLIESVYKVFKKKSIKEFLYPLLCLIVFLYSGFMYSLWHPMWACFLTIPVYYMLLNYFLKK